jgi:ABC-type lipoprotein release transport system permease subunit
MFLFSRLSARAPEVIITLIIFSLSSGVLGGVLFYMDSTAPDVLKDMTSNVPIDMQVSFTTQFYAQNQTDPNRVTIENVTNSVASQDFVTATERVVFAQVRDWYVEDYRYQRKGFLGANSSVLTSFSDAITLDSGEMSYNQNSCILEKSVFERVGAQIGGNYTIDLYVSNSSSQIVEINRTFTVVGTFTSKVYMYQPYWGEQEVTYLEMITAPDTIDALFSILGHGQYNGEQDRIWVKFDHSIIVQADSSTVVNSLLDVKRRVENENLPFALVGTEDFQLINAVYEFSMWSVSMRAIALAFSLPSVIMGFMLIQYDSRLLSDMQRKDVGTLKTRGASGMQAFSWIMSNALATGLIGSIGAIGTGIAAAVLSSSVKELLVFDLQRIQGFAILLQPTALAAVFLFSFVAGIVVALPAAVRALLMTPTEAHSTLESAILTESEKMGSPTIDLIVIGVAGWLLLPMMTVFAYGGLTSLGSLTFAAVMVAILAIFLFAFTRILSRPTAAIKSKILGMIHRPSLVVGTRLMSRTVSMFKKSEAMGTMFIAMVFTAGFFSSISATTGDMHMRQLFMFETGADAAITIDPTFTNVTLALLENISAIDGVRHVSPMLQTTGYIQYWDSQYFGGRYQYNRSITVFGVDPDTWIQTAFLLSYFTHDNPADISYAKLSETPDDGINAITSFKPIDHYTTDAIGQQVPVWAQTLDLQVITPITRSVTKCTIVDVSAAEISNSPSVTYLPGESDADDFIIVNIAFLHEAYNNTQVTKFYVNIDPGANYTQVIDDIHAIAPYTFNDIESPYTSIDQVLDSRGTQSVNGAYTLNLIFSIIYLTVGVAIVSVMRVRGLRKQLSVIRALGAQNKSVIVASLAETSLGLLIAAIIGCTIGITLAYLLMNIPLLYMGTSTTVLWTRLPVFLQLPVVLIGGVVTVSVSISLLATYMILVRTLKLNIAEEIQYNE